MPDKRKVESWLIHPGLGYQHTPKQISSTCDLSRLNCPLSCDLLGAWQDLCFYSPRQAAKICSYGVTLAGCVAFDGCRLASKLSEIPLNVSFPVEILNPDFKLSDFVISLVMMVQTWLRFGWIPYFCLNHCLTALLQLSFMGLCNLHSLILKMQLSCFCGSERIASFPSIALNEQQSNMKNCPFLFCKDTLAG